MSGGGDVIQRQDVLTTSGDGTLLVAMFIGDKCTLLFSERTITRVFNLSQYDP